MDQQVDKLISFNSQRKKKQDDAYNRCMDKITGEENFILLRMEDIHEGIAGIAAGKIKESAGRPVVIVTPSGEGFLKGTGRSIEAVDIYDVLKKHEELFVRFGGHRSACGFLMPEENFDRLKAAVDHEMEILLGSEPGLFDKTIQWDLTAEPEEINLELARAVQKMEPFGQGNQRPVLMMHDVILTNIRYMGAEKTHVRFTAVSETGGRADCVLFQRAQELKDIIEGGHSVRLTGTVGIQSWRGRESVQFTVEEIDI
jgi:single-stranded-DNA-specific exonuclease